MAEKLALKIRFAHWFAGVVTSSLASVVVAGMWYTVDDRLAEILGNAGIGNLPFDIPLLLVIGAAMLINAVMVITDG